MKYSPQPCPARSPRQAHSPFRRRPRAGSSSAPWVPRTASFAPARSRDSAAHGPDGGRVSCQVQAQAAAMPLRAQHSRAGQPGRPARPASQARRCRCTHRRLALCLLLQRLQPLQAARVFNLGASRLRQQLGLSERAVRRGARRRPLGLVLRRYRPGVQGRGGRVDGARRPRARQELQMQHGSQRPGCSRCSIQHCR